MATTLSDLINESVTHRKIARAPATLQLLADLAAQCDDSTVTRLPSEAGERVVQEFWGETATGREWRVHLDGTAHEDAARVVREIARQDANGETGGRKPSTLDTIREWHRAGGQAGDLLVCAAIDAIGEERAAEIYDEINPAQ